MAQWHLDDIENSLNRIGWTVSERLQPREDFIGGWVIQRASKRMVDFEGIFDHLGNTIKDPSLDKAYGCSIKDTNLSLYFYKKGKKWDENLSKFIQEIVSIQSILKKCVIPEFFRVHEKKYLESTTVVTMAFLCGRFRVVLGRKASLGPPE